MNESEQMRKLAHLNKLKQSKNGDKMRRDKSQDVDFITMNKMRLGKSKEELREEEELKKEDRKKRIRAQKLRKLNQDCYEYRYKYQQANRLIIQKMIKQKGNEIMLMRNEERSRTKNWVAMVYIAKIARALNK